MKFDPSEEPSAAAVRMRRYRDRRREGYKFYAIEIHGSFVDELVAGGRLSADLSEDHDEVAGAITTMLQEALRSQPKLGRVEFELDRSQIDLLVSRGHLDARARNDVNHVRRAFADFIREVFWRFLRKGRQ